jgi:hypothetical protein
MPRCLDSRAYGWPLFTAMDCSVSSASLLHLWIQAINLVPFMVGPFSQPCRAGVMACLLQTLEIAQSWLASCRPWSWIGFVIAELACLEIAQSWLP